MVKYIKKDNIQKVVLTSSVIILFIFSCYKIYEIYQQKDQYEKYISSELDSDFNSISLSLIENNKIYSKVLESGKVSYQDAYILWRNNGNFYPMIRKYSKLAYKLNSVNEQDSNNYAIDYASDITLYFKKLLGGIKPPSKGNYNDTLIKINNNNRGKFEYLRKLNSAWLKTASEHIAGFTQKNKSFTFNKNTYEMSYGQGSVKYAFWVEFIFALDSAGNKYLETEITNLKQFLFNY